MENRGIYGWWATESPSPSPGPITFTDPQRRLVRYTSSLTLGSETLQVKRADRVKEVNDISQVHEEPGKNDHERLARILREEDKLRGHRCYCDVTDGHSNSTGLPILEFERPILLITSLFRLAARVGSEIELIAYPADLRRVILRSRLSWYIFGIQSQPNLAETKGSIFRPNADFNPFEQPKFQSLQAKQGVLEVCHDWGRLCFDALTAARELKAWARRWTTPINELAKDAPSPSLTRETTAHSAVATKGTLSERAHVSKPGAFWAACSSAWATFKEATQWFIEEDIWVPESIQPVRNIL